MFDMRVKNRTVKRNAQLLLSRNELPSKIRFASPVLQDGFARASQPQVKHRLPSRVAPSSAVFLQRKVKLVKVSLFKALC